jgi:2-polyprenyl-6-hydroxyphenyl methylase/3-demethylubiquinone-9 3-methyltransferase
MNPASATLDPSEIDKFSRIARQWWDESGPFAPLHRLNPIRLGYIRSRAEAHFGLDAKSLRPFEGLSVLDVGCGGGLVCEPMVRLGAKVTGLDADGTALDVARLHAGESGLAIDYIATTSDRLADEGWQFDIVLALEIIEHVADADAFMASLHRLVKPGGLVVMSTLNRTPRSFLNAIIGAEYVLRWLPRGTHDWKKFVKPSELARMLAANGLVVRDLTGMTYDPLRREFSLGRDLATNYLCSAELA